MPAGGVKLVLHVEGAELRVLHQEMLLRQAEPAGVGAGGVRGRPGDQRPGDLVAPFQRLQIPHVLAQARAVPLTTVLEAGDVVA